MKTILAISTLAYSICLAEPVYYTFKGTIESVSNVPDQSIGDYLEYIFLVDFDKSGEQTQNGYHYTTSDRQYVSTNGALTLEDYFYTELVYGNNLLINDPLSLTLMFNQGLDYRSALNGSFEEESFYLYGSVDINSIDYVRISGNKLLKNLAIGDEVNGQNVAYSEVYGEFRNSARMNLVSISNKYPPTIPEPASGALIALGFIGMLSYGLQKNNHKNTTKS